jgi:hypothetical protein
MPAELTAWLVNQREPGDVMNNWDVRVDMEFPTDHQRLGAVSKNTTTQTSYCTQRAVRPTANSEISPYG